MANSSKRQRRLWDTYTFPGFRPQPTVRGVFGDPKARIITLARRAKKRFAGAAGEFIRVGQEIAHAAAGGEQAAEHGLRSEGILRPALGRRARGLGGALLRELARELEVAAAPTLSKVRRNDRSALGWYRRLLQAGKQGLARLRRGPQQHDPRHPAPRLRSTRPGISAAQGAHMHASSPLKLPKTPTRLPEDPVVLSIRYRGARMRKSGQLFAIGLASAAWSNSAAAQEFIVDGS